MSRLLKKSIWGLLLCLTTATAFAGASIKNGLVLYFSTVDLQARYGSGLKSNGPAKNLTVSNSPSLVSMAKTHQLSYCAWINPASIPNEFPDLLVKGGNDTANTFGGYEFVLNANGDSDLLFVTGPFSFKTGAGLINAHLGEWIHVAFTINLDTQTAQFYVNGLPVKGHVGSGTFADVNFDIANDLYIGVPDPKAPKNRAKFNGKMREVMLFNRALSPNEIQTIFSNTADKSDSRMFAELFRH